MEAETAVMWPQVKDCWPPPRGCWKRQERPSPGGFTERQLHQLQPSGTAFGLPVSRTVGQYIFVVESCLVCGNLLKQTSETNMPSLHNHLPVLFLAYKPPVSSRL